MRIGTEIPSMVTDVATVTEALYAADDSDIYSMWVQDHLFGNSNFFNAEDPQLEAYAVLCFAAGMTSRVRLGTLVTAAVYRPPGLLGKILTSLDVLSAGRCYAGLGAAWYEEEAVGLGIPFPGRAERFDRLEEVVKILLQMWRGDCRPFEGVHYRLERPLNMPACVQRPHPPLLIAGGGERRTLPLVVRYADACNLLGFDLSVVKQKLEVLREQCERAQRPYDSVEKTVWVPLDAPDNDGFALAPALNKLEILAELGVDHVIVYIPGPDGSEKISWVAELARRVKSLPAAGRVQPLGVQSH
jgi:F420-dependent oxidoreductase-like protein